MESGRCILPTVSLGRFDERTRPSRRCRCRGRPCDVRPVDAAGPVDAQIATTGSLENAVPAFSTAPTGVNKLLPMSSD